MLLVVIRVAEVRAQPAIDVLLACLDRYLADYEPRLSGVARAHDADLDRNPNTGNDMPSVVHAWIDPSGGRLLRAEVRTLTAPDANEPENDLRVEFTEDRTLAILVPSEMREVFPGEEHATGTSVARYTNFRRFQTSARIIPQ